MKTELFKIDYMPEWFVSLKLHLWFYLNDIITQNKLTKGQFIIYPYSFLEDTYAGNFKIFESKDHILILCKDHADLNYFKLLNDSKEEFVLIEVL